MRIVVKAPSNIALIKYMGKTDSKNNIPANSSLSLTLGNLCTIAEIEKVRSTHSRSSQSNWIPELPKSLEGKVGSLKLAVPALKESGIERMLSHVEKVRKLSQEIFPQFDLKPDLESDFELRTANTFPSSAGIASSASSFAAMTLVTAMASAQDQEKFKRIWKENSELKRMLIEASRKGSGSSCRSFDGPWVLWQEEEVSKVKSSLPKMTDLVLLISSEAKEISSSQAHLMVTTSPLWQGRVERANKRTRDLKVAIERGDLTQVSQIAWQELWEMHSLFHTCEAPFTFWEPTSLKALKWIRGIINTDKNPPIVTMDAGANLHVIVKSTDVETWIQKIKSQFPELEILQDLEGLGADAFL